MKRLMMDYVDLLDQIKFASDTSTDAVLITDAELEFPGPRILYCNESFTLATGYALNEIKGKTPRILQGATSDHVVLESLRRTLAKGKNYRGRTVNYHKNGTPLEVEWAVVPVRDENGDTMFYYSVQVYLVLSEANRTHLDQLSRGLLDSKGESFFSEVCKQIVRHACVDFAAILSIDEGVTTITLGFELARGTENSFHLDVDPAFFERLERDTPFDIQSGDRELLDQCPRLDKFLQANDLQIIKCLPISSGVQRGWLIVGNKTQLSHTIPVNELLELATKRLSMEFDLLAHHHELTTAQSQLFELQKMDFMGRVAGGIAHEFNNLLTTIQGFTQSTLDSAGLTESERADLSEVLTASKSAAEVTARLLTIARRDIWYTAEIFPGKQLLQIKPLLLQALGPERDLHLDVEETSLVVRGNEAAFKRILTSLCGHARDASIAGATVTIHGRAVETPAPNLSLASNAPQAVYEIVVKEEGRGMDPNILSQSLDPSSPINQASQEFGLGLVTISEWIRQLAGKFDIHSEPGSGTRMELRFPLASSQPPSNQDTVEDQENRHRIMLVEDNAAIRDLTRRLLSRDYDVVICEDAAKALVAADREGWDHFDLVLTDINMPGMSGLELVKEIRSQRPDMRIILMTGYAEEMLLRENHGDRVPLLLKPFMPADLRAIVHQVLSTCGEPSN